jgi:hypothetical protein
MPADLPPTRRQIPSELTGEVSGSLKFISGNFLSFPEFSCRDFRRFRIYRWGEIYVQVLPPCC